MKKDYIYDNQMVLFGDKNLIGFGSLVFNIKEIDRKLANDIIIKNHYSHKIYNATYIHLGIFSNDKLLGVLQYGYAMNPASQDSVVKGTKIKEYLELNRMWLDDILPKNSESKAISYSIKYIKRKFSNNIKWIQSFADERCGKFGIVYQASNFKYFGEHTSDFWELDGEIYHNIQMTVKKGTKRYNASVAKLQENKDKAKRLTLRQFRYIYFIDKRYEKKVVLEEMVFPKHYNESDITFNKNNTI
jgi:hypothetical protein